MSSLLWRPRVRPARVATDTVVPVHFFDDSLFIRPIVMYFMMRFDDVLDAEALGKSLKKLLSLDGWRKLGARMRINVRLKIYYIHLSTCFSTWYLKGRLPRALTVQTSLITSST